MEEVLETKVILVLVGVAVEVADGLVSPEFFLVACRLPLLIGESSDLALSELSLGGSFDSLVGGASEVAGGDFGLGGRDGISLELVSSTVGDFSCEPEFFLESFISGDWLGDVLLINFPDW